MNVVTLASRKGGAGKSTLTAHLAAHAHRSGARCMVVDADPQGSITLWHSLRGENGFLLRNAAQGVDRLLAHAQIEGIEWVFIDTPPTMWVVVGEAIRAATLVVIPARPSLFDLASVRETVATVRERDKPYAVVLNAAPVKRDDKEAPLVTHARAHLDALGIPVWAGQISQRAAYSLTLADGGSASEDEPNSTAASEITRLWSAVSRSVEAVNAALASRDSGNTPAAQAGSKAMVTRAA